MYKVVATRSFERDAKVLLKKYASLRDEFSKLAKELALNPTKGTPLGNNCYKIHQAIKSKGKGKSEGARIITYVITDNEEVILLAIYDKAEKANLSPGELDELLKEI